MFAGFRSGLLACLAVFYAAAVLAGAALAEDPIRMFDRAMQAKGAHDMARARTLFETVILEYPESEAARHATYELSHLDDGPPDGAATADERQDRESDEAQPLLSLEDQKRAFLLSVGDRVFFSEGSAKIGARTRAMLENQARWLIARPGLGITVIGRADDGGPADAMRDLAYKRADTVRTELVSLGLAANRIGIESHGGDDRLATCREAICEAQNRHAELLLTPAGAQRQSSSNSYVQGGKNVGVQGAATANIPAEQVER